MSQQPAGSGAGGGFHTTHWSVVLAAADADTTISQAALNQLCTAYWYPLYAYLRRQGCGPEEAQDIVQSFLARLLQRRDLESVRREKGRFRTFLLTSLRNFLLNHRERERTHKRGGGRSAISLDTLQAEQTYTLEPLDEETPEKVFARRWAMAVLDTVMGRLAAEHEASGKQTLFEALQGFLSDDEVPSQAEAAARLGLTEAAFKQALYRLRRRYRELLRDEIAHTVAQPEEIDDELRFLVASLRR